MEFFNSKILKLEKNLAFQKKIKFFRRPPFRSILSTPQLVTILYIRKGIIPKFSNFFKKSKLEWNFEIEKEFSILKIFEFFLRPPLWSDPIYLKYPNLLLLTTPWTILAYTLVCRPKNTSLRRRNLHSTPTPNTWFSREFFKWTNCLVFICFIKQRLHLLELPISNPRIPLPAAIVCHFFGWRPASKFTHDHLVLDRDKESKPKYIGQLKVEGQAGIRATQGKRAACNWMVTLVISQELVCMSLVNTRTSR